MIDLAAAGSLQADACIVAVGLAVGWAATLSGLGAGLALPVLAVLGMPLPAALLAVKLPVTVSDIVAALGERRPGLRRRQPWHRQGVSRPAEHGDPRPAACSYPAALGLSLLAGGIGAVALLRLPAATLIILMPLLALLALWLRRSSQHRLGLQPGLTAAWGLYVGGCGIGAGLLWRLGRPVSGAPGPALATAFDTGLSLRAAANTGAVLLLLGAGERVTSAICLLAASQALGAWLATQPGWTPAIRNRFRVAPR